MSAYRILVSLVFGIAIMAYAERVQGQVARYSPQRSTVSPYLALSQTNVGGLPNYYSLVRPQFQQSTVNAAQRNASLQQGQQLQQLTDDLQTARPTVAPTGTGSWFMTTGRTAGFMTTRTYYPTVNLGARRTR